MPKPEWALFLVPFAFGSRPPPDKGTARFVRELAATVYFMLRRPPEAVADPNEFWFRMTQRGRTVWNSEGEKLQSEEASPPSWPLY